MKRTFGLICLGGVIGISGCTGSSIEEGVPANSGYVPIPQPGTAKIGKGRPVTGVTEKDRKDAVAKENAPTPPATP